MQIKRNAFSYVAFASLGLGLVYLYQFMLRSQKDIFVQMLTPAQLAAVLAALAAIVAAAWFASRAMFQHEEGLKRIEMPLVVALVAAGAALRVIFAISMPLAPQSDFERYSNVAAHIVQGTLHTDGVFYCDYVARFPGTVGYSLFLAVVYALFGVGNVLAGQLANVALSMAACVFTYRAARRLAGCAGGIIALAASVFFPSQIAFSNVLASEPLFVCMLTGSLWLAVWLMDEMPRMKRVQGGAWLVLLGALIAMSKTVRSVSMIMVIALVIAFVSTGRAPKGSLRGWQCAAVLLLGYLAADALCSRAISLLVGRELASGLKMSGWYIWCGSNREYLGSYNPADSEWFASLGNAGLSAMEVQATAFDAGVERLLSDIGSLPKLFLGKFEVLWGDDGFSCDYNIIYMGQQGTLTPGAERFLQYLRMACSMNYLAMLALSGVYVVQSLRRRVLDGGYIIVLTWVGTAVLQLLLENMNRYHYHILSFLPVLAALALAGLARKSIRK